MLDLGLDFQHGAGPTKSRILPSLTPASSGMLGKVDGVHDQDAGRLRHGFNQQYAGHQRMAGKMAFKHRALFGNDRTRQQDLLVQVDRNNPVDHLEVFKKHAAPKSLRKQ